MADGLGGITPVAAQVQAPDVTGTLNSILGIQNKKQQLAIQAQTLQQQQFATAQTQGLSDFFKSWNPLDHIAPDGTTDMDAVHQSDAYKNAGLAKPLIDEQLQKITSGQIKNKTDMMSLGQQGLGVVGGVVGRLATDPDVVAGNENGRTKVNQALADIATQFPAAKPQTEIMRAHINQIDLAKNPKDLGRSVFQAQLQGQDAAKQLEITKPGGGSVQTDKGVQQINLNPYAAQGVGTTVGEAVKNVPAPGIVTLPGGSVARTAGNTATPLTVTGGAGTAAAPPGKLQPIQQPDQNAPEAAQTRYKQITADSTKHVQDVSAAANDIQNGVAASRYRNGEIIRLTDVAPTGPGKETWNHIASQFPGESGTAYQKIGHYLAQSSAAIANKMGVPNTNMGAETAAASAGNTAQNPGAIKEITKVNDALNTGLDLYNRGLAKATNNGADTSKVPAFRQAWGQNFDVNVMRYDDAVRRGDKAEIDALKTKLGADGLKRLGAERKVLHSLSETGDLP
jgi:hypothetical protein